MAKKLIYKDKDKNKVTEHVIDPAKDGIKGFRDLQKINEANQKGEKGLSEGYQAFLKQSNALANRTSQYDIADHTTKRVQAPLEDWGDSMFDNKIVSEVEFNNFLQDERANNQPWYSQIAAGVAKGAVLAGTTFADGIIGTIAGVGNLIYQASNGKVDSFTDGLHAFIDNPFSNAMQSINEEVEKLLPNYYTEAEQRQPWYNHILSANFLGDKFLKNLGFTIGAAYSGKVNAGMLGKMLKVDKLRDAFRGAAMRAGKNTDEFIKLALSGDAVIDGVKLTEDLAKAAKQMKRATLSMRMLGGVSAAMGEGRIEAIQGSNDWGKTREQYITQDRDQKLAMVEQNLAKDHPEWFDLNADGKLVLISPEGSAELQRRKDAINKEFEQGMAMINTDKAKMANVIFSLNVPLLTMSNLYQFGKFISGGFNTGRLGSGLVKGSIKDGFTKSSKAQNKALIKGITSPLMETQEEMSQQMIQEIPGAKYGSELNSFYKSKVDPEAEKETIDWVKAVGMGFNKSYGDITQWEQGFIGALTGALGAPRLRFKRNENGKIKGLSLTNEGEMYNSFREYSKLKKESQELVDRLNSSKFKERYQALIRHKKLDSDMIKAIAANKSFDYKNAELGQLVGDAIALAKAGQINEFRDMIDSFSDNLTDEQIQDIRANAEKIGGDVSIFENKTDEEVKEFVKKQAQDVKDRVEKTLKVSEDLKTLYGENIDNDYLEEITWMTTQIDDWEKRGGQLLKELRESLKGKAKEIKEKTGVDVEVLLNNYDDFQKAFLLQADEKDEEGENLVDKINKIISNNNMSLEEQNDAILQQLEETSKKSRYYENGLKVANEIKHIKKLNEKLRKKYSEKADFNLERAITFTKKKALEFKDDLQKIHDKYGVTNFRHLKGNKRRQIDAEIDALLDSYNEVFESEFAADNNTLNAIKTEFMEEAVKADEALFDFTERETKKDAPLKQYASKFDYKQKARDRTARFLRVKHQGKTLFEIRSEEKARERILGEANDLLQQIADLQKTLKDNSKLSVNPYDVQEAAKKIFDIMRIVSARSSFIHTYDKLSKNPSLFAAETAKMMKEREKQLIKSEARKIFESLDENITKEEIGQLESSLGKEIFDSLVAIVNEEGSDKIKNTFRVYQGFKTSIESMQEALLLFKDHEHIQSAINIINAVIGEVETPGEIKSEIEDIIKEENFDDALKELLQSVLDKYLEIRKSKVTTKADTNISKKSKKKSKNTASTDDDSQEKEDDENEEENEEKEEEKESPKSTGSRSGIIPEESTAKPDGEEDTKRKSKSKKSSINKYPDPPSFHIDELQSASEVQRNRYATAYEYLLDKGISTAQIEEVTAGDLVRLASTKDSVKQRALNDIKSKVGEDSDLYKYAKEFADIENKEVLAEEKKKKEEELIKSAEERAKAAREAALNGREEVHAYVTISGEKKELRADEDPILYIKSISNELLQKIVDNKAVPFDFIPDEKFLKLAKAELKARQEVNGNSTDENYNHNNVEFPITTTDSLRSDASTKYDINSLKNDRKAVVYNSPLNKALDDLGAFDFVDEGNLGDLLLQNKNLKIRYILSNTEGLEGKILLAIEVTDDIKKKADFSKVISLEGEKNKYQIIGTLRSTGNVNTQVSYENIEKLLKEELLNEKGGLDNDYVVSKKYSNNVKHIYSGRIATSTEHLDKEDRPVGTVHPQGDVSLGVYIRGAIGLRTPTISEEAIVAQPNANNSNPREGSVWLMVKGADGVYYPTGVTVLRTHEYDFSKNKDTGLIKQITKLLTIIADSSKSTYDRAIAKYELEAYIHFPEKHELYFNNDVISIKGYENNIGKGLDIGEKVEALLEALQDESLNLRFNVATSRLEDNVYFHNLVDSGILLSDLAIDHPINASFDLYNVNEEGKIVRDDSKKGEPLIGHTGNRGINSSKSFTTVYVGNVQYKVDDDGHIFDKNEEEITDDVLKTLVKTQIIISQGKYNTYKESNLYVVETSQGKRGLLGARVLSEKETKKAMKEIDKKEATRKQQLEAIEKFKAIKDDFESFDENEDEGSNSEEGSIANDFESFDEENPSKGSIEDGFESAEEKKEDTSKKKRVFRRKKDSTEDTKKSDNKNAEAVITDTQMGPSINSIRNRPPDFTTFYVQYRKQISEIKDEKGNKKFPTLGSVKQYMRENPGIFPDVNQSIPIDKFQEIFDNLKDGCK